MEILKLYKTLLIYLWFATRQTSGKSLSLCEQKSDTNGFAMTEIELFCDMSNREKIRPKLISNLFSGLDITNLGTDSDRWTFRYFDRNGKFRSHIIANLDSKSKKFWLLPRNLFGLNENVIEDRKWNSALVNNNIRDLLNPIPRRTDFEIRPPTKWFSFGEIIRYVSNAVTPKKSIFNEMKRNAKEFDKLRKQNDLNKSRNREKTRGKSLDIDHYEITKSLGNDFYGKFLSSLHQLLKSINYTNDINGYDNYLISVINNNNDGVNANEGKRSEINRNLSEQTKRETRRYDDINNIIRRKLLYRNKPKNLKTTLNSPEKRKQTDELNANTIFNNVKRSSLRTQNRKQSYNNKDDGNSDKIRAVVPKIRSPTPSISPTSVLSPPINFAYTILPEPTNDFDTFTYRDAVITDYSTQQSIGSVVDENNISVYAQLNIVA